MLVGDDVVHLLLIPIARVGNSDSGSLCHTNRLELPLRGFDHRLQVTEVRGARGHLGGEHDLLLVHDRLSVIALRVAARGLHVARVKIGRVDLPGGYLGRLEWLRWVAEPSALFVASVRAVVLIRLVRGPFDREVLLEASLCLEQPLGA